MLVYVDIIVIGNDLRENERLQRYLVNEIETKELGKLKYFLGIKIT